MNCANHSDVERAAFCQNCGKPLCRECMKTVGSAVYCEPCLAARLAGAGAPFAAQPQNPYHSASYAASGASSVPGTAGANPGASANYGAAGANPNPGGANPGPASANYGFSAAMPPPPSAGPNPILAGMLGFIPGVGAMYNGQFVKAVVHLIVFAVVNSVLVGSSGNAGFATLWGLILAGWVFYQVFDAYHTAKARRDGEPLPDPFGLNTLGDRIGLSGAQKPAGQPYPGAYAATGATASAPSSPAAGPAPYASVPPNPAQPNPFDPTPFQPSGFAPGAASAYSYTYVPQAGYAPATGYVPQAGYVPPAGYGPVAYDSPSAPPPLSMGHPLPVGAIVLIGLGIFFLLGSLDVLNTRWLGGGWPFLLIGLGVWIFISRLQGIGGLQGDGSATHRWYVLRALHFPVWAIVLTGVLALLDSWHVLNWDVGWAFYLIVWGVLVLAMRTATSQMQQESYAAAQATAASQQAAAAQPAAADAQPANSSPAHNNGDSNFEGR